MSKPQDGFVSRFLNRPISSRITRLLVKFPIYPSAFTASIFVLPIIAAVFLVRGDYLSVFLGAAIFQMFSILDGCDGEIARARNLESKFGERLDNVCDFLGSLIYVLALGSGLHHFKEGAVCALLITANEVVLRWGTAAKRVASEDFHASFYARHHGMIGHSGLLDFGERFVWWLFQLTKREMELLQLIKQNNTNQQMADRLYLSIYTVETHRKNIMQKLQLKNPVELTKFILQYNL